MPSRLLTPAFAGSSEKAISLPESVTARLNVRSISFASSSSATAWPAHVRVGLRHLDRGVVQPHHARAHVGDDRLGHDERLAVEPVEPLGDVPRKLDVLPLVVPHRHLVGVVEDDVGGHQHRVVEQAGRHALVPGRLVLELGHPLQPAHGRDAVQQPAPLGVCLHVALDEQRATVRAQPCRQQHRRHRARPAPQHVGVLRHRDGVQVDDTEKILLLVLPLGPALHRAQVVAQVKLARRLYAAEHPLPLRLHRPVPTRLRLDHRSPPNSSLLSLDWRGLRACPVPRYGVRVLPFFPFNGVRVVPLFPHRGLPLLSLDGRGLR